MRTHRADLAATPPPTTVTVQASDGGATTAMEDVIIAITNVDEPGTVTLSTLQPQVSRDIMAILDDPDSEIANTITWQWYRGSSPITGADNGENTNTSTYTPVGGDVGGRLRARAMYDDDEDENKTAQEDSANRVRRAPGTNTDPVFPDQNLNTDGVQTEQTREVAENTPAGRNLGARVSATDPGDVLTYSLDAGTDAALFDINRATGQLTTKAALDYEDTNIRESTVTVTAADPFGATVTSAVTITVTDVNEDPTVMGAASIDHAENGTELDIDAETSDVQDAAYTATDEDGDDDAATGLTWLLSGADASKFDITTSGATRILSFKTAPDYESPGDSGRNNVYEVTVKVTDSKGNSDEQDVTVKVTNMEETGTVTLSTLQPRVDFPVTATLADADNVTAGSVSWQWYKGTVTQDQLDTLDMAECVDTATNECFIKGAASDTYTPVADDVRDILVAVALYTDGSPNEDDAKDFAMMVTAQQVLADTRNKAPVFPDQDDEMEGDQTDQMRMVGENVPMIRSESATELVRPIGDPVVAMDFIIAPDTGDEEPEILTYTLGGPDADSFTIDRGTAQLSTKVALDAETKDTYTVTVTATDPSGETATVTVTIKVTDVDEAPEIMRAPDANVAPEFADSEDGARSVAEDTAAGEDIGNPVAASDANRDTLAYTLGGTDAAAFAIDSDTGQLMTLAALDYETKATYSVTVTASDSGGLSESIDVTVTVTNVEETGEVTLWAGMDALTMAPQVGDTITGAVMDPDGGVTGETWQWAKTKTPDMMESWMPITGATGAAYMVTADDTGYYLRVMATYTDAAGTAMVYSMPTMMVTMMTAPMFESETDTREVAEDTAAGEDFGNPVAANDANGDALTYALSGTDAASFDIDSATGQLMTSAALDYETKDTYTVTVTASDSGGLSDSIDVTITVTNVDEPGRVTFWRGGADATTAAIMVGDELGGAVDDSDGNPGDTFPIAMYTRIANVTSWQWARSMDMTDWEDIGTDGMYTVIDDDAGYYLRATAMYDDGEGSGKMASKETKMVGAMAAEMTLLERYDADKDGWIQLKEARIAVGDYFAEPKGEKLSLDDTRKVVGLYFEYKRQQVGPQVPEGRHVQMIPEREETTFV